MPSTKGVSVRSTDLISAFRLRCGVALAAIQGLNQKLEEARAENAALNSRLEKLEQLIHHQKGNNP